MSCVLERVEKRLPIKAKKLWRQDRADIGRLNATDGEKTCSSAALLSICFSLIPSPFIPSSHCVAFTFAVDLNCVTEINFNVSCAHSRAGEHSFKTSSPLRFWDFFIVDSVYFSASRSSYSSYCVLRFGVESRKRLNDSFL